MTTLNILCSLTPMLRDGFLLLQAYQTQAQREPRDLNVKVSLSIWSHNFLKIVNALHRANICLCVIINTV